MLSSWQRASFEQLKARIVDRQSVFGIDAVVCSFHRSPEAFLRVADSHPSEPLWRRLTSFPLDPIRLRRFVMRGMIERSMNGFPSEGKIYAEWRADT